MKLSYFRKIFSFLSIFILIAISSNSSYAIDGYEDAQDDILLENNDTSILVDYNDQQLILDEVMDGLGFRIKIRNIGNREISSIIMFINVYTTTMVRRLCQNRLVLQPVLSVPPTATFGSTCSP